jgi:hypothetical protein
MEKSKHLDAAIDAANDVAKRVYQRAAPIRNSFVFQFDDTTDVPAPLAKLVRGTGKGAGQGGATRLKLLLSLIWLAGAGGGRHDATYPARAWAQLVGLDLPETNGARRISTALDWLEANRFVQLERHRGEAATVVLLDERGDGEPYQHPHSELEGIPAEDRTRRDLYFQLPAEFWTSGWLAVLNGPAVAMLLALIAEARGKDRTSELWFSPAVARKQLCISDDTRSQGLRELVSCGLASMKRRSVNRSVFDAKKVRNVYMLDLDKLTAGPASRIRARKVDLEELFPSEPAVRLASDGPSS